MRRSTIISATTKITRDLENSGIIKMLDAAIEGMHARTDRSGSDWLSFAAIQAYLVATSTYSEADKKLLRILGLGKLSDPEIWQQLVREIDPGIVYSFRSSIRFATDVLPKINDLLNQDFVEEIENDSPSLPDQLKGKAILTVLLPEAQNEFSSPLRVSRTMEGITELYEAHSALDGKMGNDLIILACDSGSDKSFDFLGVAAAINGVRETAVAIWDRAALQKQQQHSAGLDILIKSLPIVSDISEKVEKGELSREQGELLKRKIISGATKFLEAGATTNEMYDHVRPDPHLIMRPEPKLLAAPQSLRTLDTDDRASDEVYEDELTPDELAEMQRLVAKAKKAKPPRAPTRAARSRKK